MNEQEFAQRLRQYRKEKGMTQQELADKLGVSNKTVSRWESGSYPDVTTLVALARVLDVTVDELLDPKAPVRTLEKSDWQNLLSFAFAIGGGLLFYLLAQFVPLPLCWMLYVGCLAYGIYLQSHYTYHTHWFQLGVWVMVFFVSWSMVGMLLSGVTLLGVSSSGVFLDSYVSMLLQGTLASGLVGTMFLYVLVWLLLALGISCLTVSLARRLAKEPASSSVLPMLTRKNLPRLRLCRASFHWTRAVPALAPLILMGYWCLFWRNDLPEWLYVSQKEIYVLIWWAISLLSLLPLLKKGRRGLLFPAVLVALTDLQFPGVLVYPRVYSEFSDQVMTNTSGELGSVGYHSFGQANEDLIVAAIVLALLYLACSLLTIQRVPKAAEKEDVEEDTGSF